MAHAPDPHGAPVRIEDHSAPLRRCRTCGTEKPFTRDYFGRPTRRRPDGRVREESWYLDRKACKPAALHTAAARTAAQRKAGVVPPPPIAKALGQLDLPKPSKPSFRSVLQEAVEPDWPKIAKQMAKQAAAGEKNMIKLVAAYILGTPREATEDEGPAAFWHALLAHAGAGSAGSPADESATDDELAGDPEAD